jgi:hypothetical protein
VSGTAFVRFRGQISIHVGARQLVCPADRLSLSGIQLYSPIHESAGSFMRLGFELDRVGPLEVDGYLVSSVKVKGHFRWHVQFHNVHEQIASKLVQWAEVRTTPARPHKAVEGAPDGERRDTRKLPTMAPPRVEPAWIEQSGTSEAETAPSLPAVVLPDDSPRVGVPRPAREEPAFLESDTTPVR